MGNDSMDALDLVARELQSMDFDDVPEELFTQTGKSKSSEKDDEDLEEEEETVDTDEEGTDEEGTEDSEEEGTTEEDEDTEEPDDLEDKKTKSKKKPTPTTSEEDTLGDYEEDISKYVTEKLEKKLGVSLGEFKTVDEIVDGLASMVSEATENVFADDEIAELNEFVKNGGKLKDFIQVTIVGRVDPETINLEREEDQKRIIRQNLKDSGYKDSQIDRKLERYEDLGTLRDEAEDALEVVKETTEKEKKKLLVDTENSAKEAKERQQKFISNVEKSIKEIKDIRGIPVSELEKKEMFKALFVPEADGKTKFQKIYASDVKHLIESVFFTLKGDVLIKRAQARGATTTSKLLKDKLSQKGNRIKKSTNVVEREVDPLSAFAAALRKF